MASTVADTPHPLAQLSAAEFRRARDIVRGLYGSDTSVFFRAISLKEPSKAELVSFLEAEHAGNLTADTKRPPRLALVEHDLVRPKEHEHMRAVVDIETGDVISKESAGHRSYPYYTP
jgi:primary-amine oxidase